MTPLIPKNAISIAAFRGEKFQIEAMLFNRDGQECVVIEAADCDVNADGANGQNGGPWAYKLDDTGTEALANGGFRRLGDGVICVHSWGNDILIMGGDGFPKVFKKGGLASKTAYHFPDVDLNDPAAYLDSETIVYAVVSPEIIKRTSGAVLGCKVVMTNLDNGREAVGVVGDVGPRNKIGEASIEACRQLGLDANPRTGGTERPIIRYEFFPGLPGIVDDSPLRLLRANGTFLP